MPIANDNRDMVTRIFFEFDMDRIINFYLGGKIARAETVQAENFMADLIRLHYKQPACTIWDEQDIYLAFYIDSLDLIRYDPATLVNRIKRTVLTGLRGKLWTDYLMNMWGYSR